MTPVTRAPSACLDSTRRLIVNADDFGMSAGINAGIIDAHEHGIVTSASLMVRWPAAEQAAQYARGHASLGVGLHLDLGEWVYRDGQWSVLYRVVVEDDADAVEREARRQLEQFREVMAADPTHLDSHQHVHRSGPLHATAMELARELGVPLRDCTGDVRYIGNFYGQTGRGEPYAAGISAEALAGLIRELPEGFSEVSCHPGYAEPELASPYRTERAREVAAMCDVSVRRAIEEGNVQLCNFTQCRPGAAGGTGI